MEHNTISIIIPSYNDSFVNLEKLIKNLSTEPLVSEIIVIDDCSPNPLDLKGCRVFRNNSRMGNAACRMLGLSLAKYPIVITMDSCVAFKTKQWGQRLITEVLANPKGIICPACIPTGDCSFKGKLYGGCLDVVTSRRGFPIVLESKWNKEIPPNNQVECAMGGAYALNASWHRKIGSYQGIKGCDPVELIALSLKTRLAGGIIKILPDVEIEHVFAKSYPIADLSKTTYNKLRLATVVLPPDISTVVPILLSKSADIKAALAEFMADFGQIVAEKNLFWTACGKTPTEAASMAGMQLDLTRSVT